MDIPTTTDKQDEKDPNAIDAAEPNASAHEAASNVPPVEAQGFSRRSPALFTTPTNGERFTKSTTFRMVWVGILILLMLIPLAMVSSIVDERAQAYNTVLGDISEHWGGEQVLTGPILILPCTQSTIVVEQTADEKGHLTSTQREIVDDFQAVVLPEKIHLEGAMTPEYRFRGIYQSLVYSEHLTLTGNFSGIAAAVSALAKEGWTVRAHWDKAFIVVGLTDTKGITRIAPLRFGGKKLNFAPGTRMSHLVSSGFHAPLLGIEPGEHPDFSLEMDIKGSNGFKLAPLGELSEMHLTSGWAHPSFYGDILPTKRTVTDKGFDAAWSVPHLVRAYPQYWMDSRDNAPGISGFSVGVRLFEPVTVYTEATRATKYGILFIALTFLTLALLEIITRSRPSMVQYVMIGIAMTLFYVLLIALAEHIGFNKAYLAAAGTAITLNTVYCLFVLSRKLLAFVVTAVLAGLYSVLFMTLRAEDYALLAGALLLAAATAVTMFFTRNLHKRI